jgi:hypothetical protein
MEDDTKFLPFARGDCVTCVGRQCQIQALRLPSCLEKFRIFYPILSEDLRSFCPERRYCILVNGKVVII